MNLFLNWLEKLQHIDSRILYLLLAVVLAIPLVFNMSLPIPISPAAQGAYDAVEHIPSDKIAIVSVNWSSGTEAENQPQMDALIRHLFLRHKKFAILAFDPQGSKFGEDTAARLSKELGKTYGKDWMDFGFRPIENMVLTMQGMARDLPGTLVSDIHGTPLSAIPMMRGVKDIHDVGLIADITSIGTIQAWIAFIYGPYRTPLVYAPTAVMAPEAFNMLDAGQIKGMLIGMKGAAEYEKLLGRKDFATKATASLSTSHLLIIVMIILGNVGYISSRRRRRE